MNQPIILFDGICNLCNAAVQFVIRHDPQGRFKFASLQGESGQQLLKKHGLRQDEFSSFVLINDETVFTKSTAALKVAAQLTGAYRILGGFIFVPAVIRDAVYNVVARNRYRWFGKRDSCMTPNATLSSRFLN